jgi:O-antigen ligase
MLSGIFFLWDTLVRLPDRKNSNTRRILVVNVAFLAMTLWLLKLSNSATSKACLAVGGLIIVVAGSKWGLRHKGALKVLLPVSFVLYVIFAFGFGFNDDLAVMMGRDPSLTGRTNIWEAVLSTNTNALVGTGYDSFWLGPRLAQVWAIAGPVNEAHNGYLEWYLEFGVIGLVLLGGLLLTTYRSIWRNLSQNSSGLPLAWALWYIALFYNITEAAFTPAFMCLTWLMLAVVVPPPIERPNYKGMYSGKEYTRGGGERVGVGMSLAKEGSC